MTLMYHLLKIQMKGKKTRATAPVIKRVIGARPPLTVEAGERGQGRAPRDALILLGVE